MTEPGQHWRAHVAGSVATQQRMLDACEAAILGAAARIAESLKGGGKLLLCGNGGSAAGCQHIAAELVSVLRRDHPRPGLAAIALTTDTSLLTASANDFGFAGIFERQVQALGRAGDTVLGISTTGDSENVRRALGYARAHGMGAIALTGEPGGKLAGEAEISIRVPSPVVMHIQEAHLVIGHVICELVERAVAIH